MHNATKKKIEFLQGYMVKHHKKWFELHSDSIVGLRIDKKNKKGRYSIIFQVKKKIGEDSLKKKNIIPKCYKIKFPDGITRMIATDVEQTGIFRFHLQTCKKPLNNGNIEVGTIGVFLKDSQNIYGLTNYHVVAGDRMANNDFFFNGNDNNIFVEDQPESFVEGTFSNEIDVAFIQLNNHVNTSNTLIDGTTITGYVGGPITPQAIGTTIRIYSRINQQAFDRVMSNNAAIFDTGFNNIKMKDIIQSAQPITKHGDSGGPVLIDNSILGIIVGSDDSYDYIIPFFKIRNFKPLEIL